MDALQTTLDVMVGQSAILQILDIGVSVAAAREEEETNDMSKLVYELRNSYRDYQRLQQNFFARSPAPGDPDDVSYMNVTEEDLKRLFSSDEYEELRAHIYGIERNFLALSKSIQLIDIKANWLRKFLHLTKGRKNESELEKSYANAVETMHTLDLSVSSDLENKFINKTLEVVKTFSSNLAKSCTNFDGFEPLAVRVRIEDSDNVENWIETIKRDLTAIARIINTRQLYPRPNFTKGTHAVAWELNLNATPDRSTISVEPNKESSILPEHMRQFELLVEVRSPLNSHQKEVPTGDFKPSGKYRGVCKLRMKFYVEKYPNQLIECEASGWLIDDRTVVTCGHCVYMTKTSPKAKEDYGILRAKQIEVYIGYYRGVTVGSSDVEMRKGKWALTHRQWYDRWERDCDIAMVRLEKAFDNPGTFPYVDETPMRGDEELTVVGYPGDIPPNVRDSMPVDSAGTVMYESSQLTRWDLNSMSTRLRYRTDTYAGNSGGPVLRRSSENTLEVIGVHATGEEKTGMNSAIMLGHHGNHLPTLLAALNSEKDGIFPNGRFCDDKVVGWPQVQILQLPYVTQ